MSGRHSCRAAERRETGWIGSALSRIWLAGAVVLVLGGGFFCFLGVLACLGSQWLLAGIAGALAFIAFCAGFLVFLEYEKEIESYV